MDFESKGEVRRRASVCLVTTNIDLYDPLAEESLSMMALAQRLATATDVILLWVPDDPKQAVDAAAIDYFANNHDIKLNVLRDIDLNSDDHDGPEYRSFRLYEYLKQNQFDTVYFPLEQGLAYYALHGKETGVYRPESRIVVVAHSPREWIWQADRFFPKTMAQVKLAAMERYCAGAADRLICVSISLHKWLLDRGWVLSSDCCIAAALSPLEWLQAYADSPARPPRTKELVLIASHRFRDGMTLFCDMLDEISALDIGDVCATVIGRFGKILGEHSGGMIIRRGRRWPFPIRLKPDLTVFDGVQYAKRVGGIAVIPNFESAAGYAVSQCLLLGVPFVATQVGGNVDQLAAESARLVKPDAASLATALVGLLSKPPALVPQWNEDNEHLWVEINRSDVAHCGNTGDKAGTTEPLLSVIVIHRNQPQNLLQTLASLSDQNYPNFEVVLVVCGSRSAEPSGLEGRLSADFAKRGWKLVQEESTLVGTARSAGVKEARGEMILFLDEDDFLLPGALSVLVAALGRSHADICAALGRKVRQSSLSNIDAHLYTPSLPLGDRPDFHLLGNGFADSIFIYRRHVFDQIGKQLDTLGPHAVDREFLVRAERAKLRLRLIPEVLFRRRVKNTLVSAHPYDDLIQLRSALAKDGLKELEHVLDLYMGQNIDPRLLERSLSGPSQSPSDLLHRELARLDPNSSQALDLLARIAALEGREATAIGIVAQSRTDDFGGAAAELIRMDPASLTAVRATNSALSVDHRLTSFDLQMIETATSLPSSPLPLSYVDKPNRFFLHSTQGGLSVAVLAAAGPPTTMSVLCVVSLQEAEAEGAEFLVLLTPMRDDPVIAATSALSDRADGSSGWVRVSAPHKPVIVEASLAEASSAPSNLVLAIRAGRTAKKPVLGCFAGIIITTSVEDRLARRTRLGTPSRPWTELDRRSAHLLTEYKSDLPLLLFPKELDGGLFLRPSIHGPVVAVLDNAFPTFAREVLGKVEIAHDEAAAFEFAMAVSHPQSPHTWDDIGPADAIAFSGWIRVESKFKLHDVKLRVRELCPTPLSLSIAVKLPRGSKPSPSNAFWRSLLFLWDQ